MKRLIIVLCLFWFAFIFYMSGKPGEESHQDSVKVVSAISKNENSSISINNKKIYLDTIARKNAHAFEYTVLAFLVSASFFSFDKRGRGIIIYILFICLFYAVTDEFHQSFVPGRSSRASDVLIDFGGSIIGMLLFYLTYYEQVGPASMSPQWYQVPPEVCRKKRAWTIKKY